MAVNVGVILLSSRKIDGERLDIEDNIGESIHLHYKNIRFDFTVTDFLRFSTGCKQAQTQLTKTQLTEYIAKKDLSDGQHPGFGLDPEFSKSCKRKSLQFKEIITVHLNELVVTESSDGKDRLVGISESVIFTALSKNDKKLYEDHIESMENKKTSYCWEGLMELKNSFESVGYDERSLIATKEVIGENGSKEIIDGQHRACILYYLHRDIKIKVAHFIESRREHL
tara:strand:+ start:1128 stop:1805 length:678 start_codon:yes stop_codon:yes gene_type:complete